MRNLKLSNKFIAVLASCLLLTSCGNIPENYQGFEVHFNSSNEDLNRFMNDYAHRNLRYDEYAAGQFAVSDGTGFAKNWETMGLVWNNASIEAMGEDRFQKIYNFLYTISQDDKGMIYNTHQGFDSYIAEAGDNCPQGWPFPTWKQAVYNGADVGNLNATLTTTFEFNDSLEDQSTNWKADNGQFNIPAYEGYSTFSSSNLRSGEVFRFYKDDINDLLKFSHGIDSRCAPMVEIDLEFYGNNIKDYYLIWKTSEGGDTWFSAPAQLYASTPTHSFTHFHERQYLSMYLNPEWDNKIITALGIEFRGEENQIISVNNGICNYIRPQYDTRQSNATYQWILAFYNYYRFTQNNNALATLMPKARKAIMFLTHALQGEKGLLNIDYLYGHSGVGIYKEDESYLAIPYEGVGNGYWDVTASSEINLEANTYFYQALNAMSYLEDCVNAANIEFDDEVLSVSNRIPGEDRISYGYNSESLKSLANTVKANMEKEIKPVLQDNGRYQNEGGFYCKDTGRFALGINELTGKVNDYGFVYFNEEAVAAGIGTDSQQQSIMSWINGDRIVSGDKSTGDDIYFYEFAPRSTTKDCEEIYSFSTLSIFAYLLNYGISTWSRQVQNGGAVITWSYYDLICREKVLGKENAYKRFKEIKDWYLKVLDNTTQDGIDFYSGYYDALQDQAVLENEEMENVYSIQDSGRKGPGAMGLDAEFIESVILVKAIPDTFFKMDTPSYDNISFTNNKPNDLKFYQIENMKYKDAIYSVRLGSGSIEIFNIKGVVSKNQMLTLKIPTSKVNIRVFVNNVTTKNYEIIDGYVNLTIPFDNVKVFIR